jgi:CRP/FNR family transcriptional regulator
MLVEPAQPRSRRSAARDSTYYNSFQFLYPQFYFKKECSFMHQNECTLMFKDYCRFGINLTRPTKGCCAKAQHSPHIRKAQMSTEAAGSAPERFLSNQAALRAYIMSEQGKEVTLYRLYPGDLCMLSASCVLKAITFDVYIDAEEDSECYVINGRVLAEITEHNIHAENFALNMAVERFSDVMWVMQQILFMSFDRRLAIFLWDEISKTGDMTFI